MQRISVLARFHRALVAWLLLSLAPVAGASSLVVQQIGEVRGRIAEAVVEQALSAGVYMVPRR
ncbi:MAG: hypothetical protein L0H73_13060 [Nitrococcus sp.]|nr:hypothetical protein [Nitrococcus sp.]